MGLTDMIISKLDLIQKQHEILNKFICPVRKIIDLYLYLYSDKSRTEGLYDVRA